MLVADKLCYYSRLRYVNPYEKVAFSVITLCLCIISRSFVVAGIVFLANAILTVKKGHIPIGQFLRLFIIPGSFLALSTLTIVANISSVPLDGYAIFLGSYYLTGSKASICFGLRLGVTALSALSCLYFLSLSTTMTDILSVLKKLHFPEILIELMLLIYRFIFVLWEGASTMLISVKARLGDQSLKKVLTSFGFLAAGLLVRSMKRARDLYDAMEARCYTGHIFVLDETNPAKTKEILAIVGFELFLIGITIWRMCK